MGNNFRPPAGQKHIKIHILVELYLISGYQTFLTRGVWGVVGNSCSSQQSGWVVNWLDICIFCRFAPPRVLMLAVVPAAASPGVNYMAGDPSRLKCNDAGRRSGPAPVSSLSSSPLLLLPLATG